MLLTITTTHQPATDLGYLLHKNPARAQSADLSFGRAHVVYPEATAERCTAALVLDVDSVGLVRGRRGPEGNDGTLAQYVNDRPYVASSFLSVAIADLFGTAMNGRSKDRPELAATPIPLVARVAVVPAPGGHEQLVRLFEPLGWTVSAEPHALDATVPEWGASRYFTLTLTGEKRLAELLAHLYVLMPVLDDEKHYWVGDAEVEKLLRVGAGWLAAHPERDFIARRYLRHQRSLVRDAVDRLVAEAAPEEATEEVEVPNETAPDETAPGEVAPGVPHESPAAARDAEELKLERTISLNEQRMNAVFEALKASGARTVVDLGCGEGRLLRRLFADRQFERAVGMDVSHRALEVATSRLRLDRMPEMKRAKVALLHGSLVYRDQRIAGFDAAAVVEVIEHLDPPRLAAFERAAFEFARPGTVVLTTPNAEYNVRWESLPAGKFRHRDHRFEWTRAELETWAHGVAARFGYAVRFETVGPVDAEVGSPTQMAIFTRRDGATAAVPDAADAKPETTDG